MADTTTDEVQERKLAAIEAEMEAQGVSTSEGVYEDYFGFDDVRRFTFPDGKSFIEFKVMTEGERRKFLNKQNRQIRIKKTSGDAEMSMSPGDERYHLLKSVIVNWNLRRNGEPVPFNNRTLDEFLENANPRVIDPLEKEVRKAHPWLMAELTVEDIDQEIANLQEMREVVLKEQEGN